MYSHGHRQERLADQIRIEVAEMVLGELQDPRIGFATVTRVELSPDMRHCRVMVSVMGDEAAQRDTLAGLSSAAGFVRRELGQRLRLKRAPEIVFTLDRGEENLERVGQILNDLREDKEI
jgi:ribosome-binding factor A